MCIRDRVVAARIRELVGTPFYDAKTETERPLRYCCLLYTSRRSSNFLAANRLRGFRIGSKAQMAEYSQFWQALNAPRSTGESSISPR